MPLRFVATFEPQAWVNDHCISVDAIGDCAFDVTAELRRIDKASRHAVLQGIDFDDLKEAASAPAWIREWDGPFYLSVDVARVPPRDPAPRRPEPPTLPTDVERICLAWDLFCTSITSARAAAACIKATESAKEDYLTAFKWEGARWDEGRRTAREVAQRLVSIAQSTFAPSGGSLEIKDATITTAFEIDEESLRECARGACGSWDITAAAIEAKWMTFDPRAAWRELDATYSVNAAQISRTQLLDKVFYQFGTRRGFGAARGLDMKQTKKGAVLSIQVSNYNDGMLQPGSKASIFNGLTTLAEALALSINGSIEIAGVSRQLSFVARQLEMRKRLASRERYDLGAGCFVTTFSARLDIHLSGDVAAAFALFCSEGLTENEQARAA